MGNAHDTFNPAEITQAAMADRINTSDEAIALACMIVTNPGGIRKDGDGWQKPVNDLIRALREERNALQMENRRLKAELDVYIAGNRP